MLLVCSLIESIKGYRCIAVHGASNENCADVEQRLAYTMTIPSRRSDVQETACHAKDSLDWRHEIVIEAQEYLVYFCHGTISGDVAAVRTQTPRAER